MLMLMMPFAKASCARRAIRRVEPACSCPAVPEHEGSVERELGRIADRQSKRRPGVLGDFRSPDRPERHLEAPEHEGGDDAEGAIERHLPGLAGVAVEAVLEHEAL